MKQGRLSTGDFLRALAVDSVQKEEEATHDPLLGIYTRRAGERRLDEALAVADRDGTDITVAMLDLDHFKKHNDTLGHLGGDVILKKTAEYIDDSVRKVDIVFRYGGEELMVVFAKTDETTAGEVIDRVREAMPDTVDKAAADMGLNLQGRKITMSAGIAQARLVTTDGVNDWKQQSQELIRNTLFEQSDAAMYKAKGAGRNRVYDSQGDVTIRLAARRTEQQAA